MKKIFAIFTILLLVVSCTTSEEHILSNELILKGYADVESRTAFGNPDENKIPYLWSSGDYIWLGSVKSNPIAEDCLSAQFKWQNTPSTIDAYHLFYNMTAEANNAKVLAEQSADGNLGNDGDFGYALADEFGVFVLEHKTAYIWFDTTSSDVTAKLYVLFLVDADGNDVGLIQKNIGCHKCGICEKSRIDIIRMLCGLILELSHSGKLAKHSITR